MSSLSVFHGLQSCLDSQTNPDDIIKPQQLHRSSRPVWVFAENQASDENRASFHGLKSVNFLNNPVMDIAPPLPAIYAKQTLSTNSNLDMCTETLGCETGAMCSGYELEIGSLKKRKKKKKMNPTPSEFPPPLTTLSGEGRLRLGRKREKGRLLLIPFKPFAVESERSGGRLRLRILPAKEMEEAQEGGGGEEGKEKLGGEDEDGLDEKGCFGNGGGGKYRRCKEGEGGGARRKKIAPVAIFNCDSFLVASS
ncbi:hypothetical protein KFK09_007395 [Dendrobium nobile]|uniref:FAF domain-containing protein n=1 Tax=Dendrobium nobile TaxID=94219 RepID=A0A8T3BWR8_DENNO|nr:hypothetical protein KFK09_007394 [Dendrobium nobile]KAI0519933.1 hypothetical protein KFK09_007395 [Dendrobium nobile]